MVAAPSEGSAGTPEGPAPGSCSWGLPEPFPGLPEPFPGLPEPFPGLPEPFPGAPRTATITAGRLQSAAPRGPPGEESPPRRRP